MIQYAAALSSKRSTVTQQSSFEANPGALTIFCARKKAPRFTQRQSPTPFARRGGSQNYHARGAIEDEKDFGVRIL